MTDIFSMTPDEFRAQQDAERRADQEAREARERAEAATREAEAAKEREKARLEAKILDDWYIHLKSIGEATNLTHEVVRATELAHFPPYHQLVVDGVRLPLGTGYGSRMTLEIAMPWYTVPVRSWDRRRPAAEKCVTRLNKHGEFDYDRIAAFARRYVAVVKKHERDEAAKMSAEGVVSALRVELDYRGLDPSADPERPVQFKFSITRSVTADEARRIHAALVAAGLIEQKEGKQ